MANKRFLMGEPAVASELKLRLSPNIPVITFSLISLTEKVVVVEEYRS